MSILNVFLSSDRLLVAVDTWAEDALTQKPSAGAKLLLIPHHNLVLASRGSAQCFLKIYELCLQASFRADFTMEKLMAELGLVMDHLWPSSRPSQGAGDHQRFRGNSSAAFEPRSEEQPHRPTNVVPLVVNRGEEAVGVDSTERAFVARVALTQCRSAAASAC